MSKTEPERLAIALRKARERLNETQAQFASRTGVNQATISRWERLGPRTGPSRITAQQILTRVEQFYGPVADRR
jgi:transcriptional regulator with XRE-family HTH domain